MQVTQFDSSRTLRRVRILSRVGCWIAACGLASLALAEARIPEVERQVRSDLSPFVGAPNALSFDEALQAIEAVATLATREKTSPGLDDTWLVTWAIAGGEVFGRALDREGEALVVLYVDPQSGRAVWWTRTGIAGGIDTAELPLGASPAWMEGQLRVLARSVSSQQSSAPLKLGLGGGGGGGETFGEDYMIACNADPSLCLEEQVRVFTPVDDAWVEQDDPNATRPTTHTLRLRPMDTGSARHGYIKFNVQDSVLDDMEYREITNVKLQLRAGNYGLSLLSGYHMADNSWSEETLTWSNASIDHHGHIIFDLTPWAPNETRVYNLTGTVTEPGMVTYGITSGIETNNYVWSKDTPNEDAWPVLRVRYRFLLP